jgi:histidinol-phosphate/aromatic aminotransferase/cobyric acid decarboxylase-like protein
MQSATRTDRGARKSQEQLQFLPTRSLAIAGAVAAIDDQEHFETPGRLSSAVARSCAAQLLGLGFEVLPSAANFIFARHPQHDAGRLAAALRQRGIIVRHFRLATHRPAPAHHDRHRRTMRAVLVEALAGILGG